MERDPNQPAHDPNLPPEEQRPGESPGAPYVDPEPAPEDEGIVDEPPTEPTDASPETAQKAKNKR